MPTAHAHDGPGPFADRDSAILRELHTIAQLLDRGEQFSDFAPAAIIVSDDQRAVREQRDWPIQGGRRYIVGKQGFGSVTQLSAGVPAQILPANLARIGGIITAGATPVTLFLGSIQAVQGGEIVPQIPLAANGVWNFMLGPVLWGGNVSAQAAAGSSVVVAEV